MSAMKTVLAIDKHFTQLAFIKTSTTQLGCLHTITYTHTHTHVSMQSNRLFYLSLGAFE